MGSRFGHFLREGFFPFRILMEILAFLSVAACALSLILRYPLLPDRVPDLFAFGSDTVSKFYLICLFAVQTAAYLLLTLFQLHPDWRLYSSKLLPLLKEEESRKTLYRFNSLFLLTAKTETALLLSSIVLGTVLGKNMTGPAAVMMAVMILTLIFFKTDMPKQVTGNMSGH